MPSGKRSRSLRRSTFEWAVRSGLAAYALLLGWLSTTQALGYVTRRADIEHAHVLAPGDGRVTALLAQSKGGLNASPADRLESQHLARLALLQDPTAVIAASTLAFNASLNGDEAASRGLFGYAWALSRRDLQTDLWVIEDAVNRDDISGALRGYDTTLRTQRNAPELLYSVLASAMSDRDVRAELAKTLAGDPPWRASFVEYMAAHAQPHASAALSLKLERFRIATNDAQRAIIIQRLVDGGFYEEAWNYYGVERNVHDRARSRDPQFSARIVAPAAFDWVPIDSGGVSASLQSGERGGVFGYSAPASVGGPALQQAQVLPPGDYQLVGRSSGIVQATAELPYWLLTCLDGREIARIPVPSSASNGGGFAGRLAVPRGCPMQRLVFVVSRSNAASGSSGQIDSVQILPADQAKS